MRTCYLCGGGGIHDWTDVRYVTREMAMDAGDVDLEGERLEVPRTGTCPICNGSGEVK
jgi:hypothetical protein